MGPLNFNLGNPGAQIAGPRPGFSRQITAFWPWNMAAKPCLRVFFGWGQVAFFPNTTPLI